VIVARRRAIAMAVAGSAIVLTWCVWNAIQGGRALPPRENQIMRLRALAWYLDAYARQYHRPAFYLDSVVKHLAPLNAKRFTDLEVDLWGDSVLYIWTYCGYKLVTSSDHLQASDTTPRGPATEMLFDSTTGLGRGASEIAVLYRWPPGTGRTQNCWTP